MSRKKKRGKKAPAPAIPFSDWLPPESSPNKYYSQLVFSDVERGSGPRSIVGRELQLVWYKTQRDRDRERSGKLVCVLEFRSCRRNANQRGERYQFTGLLLEDMSGEYREWLGHQEHRGRPFGEETGVHETKVQFSVAVQKRTESPFVLDASVTRPFTLHKPRVEDLSSPQVDMLFDAMSFLYQSIPAMKLMEEIQARHVAELTEKEKQLAVPADANL